MAQSDASLDDLRRRIDEIDDALHDLLMQRGELAVRVGRAKGGNDAYIRPGREAKVLRRLIGRHRGPLPKAVLVRIWREIFAVGTALQSNFAVVVHGGEGREGLRALAREHFGVLTPITVRGSVAGVLEAVTDGEATVGVLAMPEPEETDPWWRRLAREGERVPRIIARLPFAPPASAQNAEVEALVVGLAPLEATGDDRSYLALEVEGGISRSALSRALGKAGFAVVDMKHAPDAGQHDMRLVECEGAVMADDERLMVLPEASREAVRQVWVLGCYAAPLSRKALA